MTPVRASGRYLFLATLLAAIAGYSPLSFGGSSAQMHPGMVRRAKEPKGLASVRVVRLRVGTAIDQLPVLISTSTGSTARLLGGEEVVFDFFPDSRVSFSAVGASRVLALDLVAGAEWRITVSPGKREGAWVFEEVGQVARNCRPRAAGGLICEPPRRRPEHPQPLASCATRHPSGRWSLDTKSHQESCRAQPPNPRLQWTSA
jgi:hypothetical protein